MGARLADLERAAGEDEMAAFAETSVRRGFRGTDEEDARRQPGTLANVRMHACPDSADATLDPRTADEWNALRADAQQMLEQALDRLETIREEECWQPMPAELRRAFEQMPLPVDGRPLAEVHRDFVTNIVPYTTANRNPRAWGWVRGQGTAVAMLADMLASGLNAHVGGGATAPVLLEETVLGWLRDALGYAPGASGVLTSGATMANLLGLLVARNARAGFDVREEGLTGAPRMTLYCSDEVHGWAAKAVEAMGMGRRSLRLVPTDADYRMDLHALEQQIATDKAEGCQPIAVIATAGTVNTGAFDDLAGVRAVCDAHGLWMHVDGAYGALLRLVPGHEASAYAGLVSGLERADSVAFDLHKWMSLPFETGCLLVRDAAQHEATFKSEAAYMERAEGGMLAAGWPRFSDRGIEGSRSFRALRVWMQLETLGLRRHAEVIAGNMRQAAFLRDRIAAHPRLQMAAPSPANVVCFGYRLPGSPKDSPGSGPGDSRIDSAAQRAIVLGLQESGRFVVSGTTVKDGTYVLRVAIVNHRSRLEDLVELLDAVVTLGDEISGYNGVAVREVAR